MRGLIQCLVLSVEQFSKAKRGFTKRCKKWHRFIRHWTNLIFPLASFTKSNSWIDGYKKYKEARYFQISLRSHLWMNFKNSSHSTCITFMYCVSESAHNPAITWTLHFGVIKKVKNLTFRNFLALCKYMLCIFYVI